MIHFEDHDKGFVLNKTNAKTIAKVLDSEDFEDWTGKNISLYRTEVEFQGEMVEAIRVKLKSDKSEMVKTKQATQNDYSDYSDIPF